MILMNFCICLVAQVDGSAKLKCAVFVADLITYMHIISFEQTFVFMLNSIEASKKILGWLQYAPCREDYNFAEVINQKPSIAILSLNLVGHPYIALER